MSRQNSFGWFAIVRLGLVQSALGAIVVLTTSTLNRVMVVELALPAVLPGALVALHYVIQISRPRFGHGADQHGHASRWIIGGMAVLAFGAVLATAATLWMTMQPIAGLLVAILAFVLVGAGVGASGTALLALMARRVAAERRGAAAAVVWLMMIVGIIVTAGVAGALLEPFSLSRLFYVALGVAGAAVLLTIVAVAGIERGEIAVPDKRRAEVAFSVALASVWADDAARRFAMFVFVAMLAYSMQDLILEPFAGQVFGLSPGQSTQLTGIQHGGVLAGMLLVGALASGIVLPRIGTLRGWAIAGCLASAVALVGLIAAGILGPPWPLSATVAVLGAANGGFAVAAIALMMGLAGAGDGAAGEGTRVGVWGAAQALAFGLGGLLGTAGVDVLTAWLQPVGAAYAAVFGVQALLFVWAARVLPRVDNRAASVAIGSVTTTESETAGRVRRGPTPAGEKT